jgi:hypothetical protein
MTAEYLIMSAFTLIPILAGIGVGGLMVYSAFTGKGIKEPPRETWAQLRVQYHLRGPIGLAFFVAGLGGLVALVRSLFLLI